MDVKNMHQPIHLLPLLLLKWKLVSKTFKSEGELLLNVMPDIEVEYKTVLIEDPSKVRKEEGDIEDYIIEKEEQEDD